jgi:hypothetical protein
VRKLVAYELLSLDGVAEEPLDFITDFDEVMSDAIDTHPSDHVARRIPTARLRGQTLSSADRLSE